MTYRSLLTCLTDPQTAPATLALAFQLGRIHRAHVECLHVRNDASASVPLVGEGMSGAMLEEMLAVAERQAAERASLIRGQFDQARLTYDAPLEENPAPGLTPAAGRFSTHWREVTGREEELFAAAARLSDLTVMARPLADQDTPSLLSLNAVLMESGRPLLLAPPTLPATVARSIAVLWNGSAESSRAVASALPLLRGAEKIAILSAHEEGGTVTPAELVTYLGWHGLAAGEHSFAPGGQTGQTLLTEAAVLGADLVVMGAYTHSRLRQLILGGVTRHVLQHATIPILLSH